jgi:hypothetical protein
MPTPPRRRISYQEWMDRYAAQVFVPVRPIAPESAMPPRPVSCAYCGSRDVTLRNVPRPRRTDTLNLCATCATTDNITSTCEGPCGRPLYIADLLPADEVRACRDCLPALGFQICPRCSRARVSDSFGTSHGYHEPVCRLCFDHIERATPPCMNCRERRQIYARDDAQEQSLCTVCVEAARGALRLPGTPTVGIELEFCTPRGVLSRLALWPWGSLHGDGSVQPEPGRSGGGAEFSSHVCSGPAIETMTRAVCEALRARNAWVNSTCGFHLHIGVNDMTASQRQHLRTWWTALEPVFFAVVAPSRRRNRYCTAVRRFANAGEWNDTRYSALNLLAQSEHGTYEIRLHHGTLCPDTILNWTRFSLAFFEHFSRAPLATAARMRTLSHTKQVRFMFDTMHTPLPLQAWVLKQIETHNQRATFVREALKHVRALKNQRRFA